MRRRTARSFAAACSLLFAAVNLPSRSWHRGNECFFPQVIASAIPRREAVQGALMALEAAKGGVDPFAKDWPNSNILDKDKYTYRPNFEYKPHLDEADGSVRVKRTVGDEVLYSFQLPPGGGFEDKVRELGPGVPSQLAHFVRLEKELAIGRPRDLTTVSVSPLPAGRQISLKPGGNNLYYRKVIGPYQRVSYSSSEDRDDLFLNVNSLPRDGHEGKWIRILRGKNGKPDLLMVLEGFRYEPGRIPNDVLAKEILDSLRYGA